MQGRIIVTLMGGVFDVTDFTGHPGGYGRLQMVAGQAHAPPRSPILKCCVCVSHDTATAGP